MWIVLQFIPKVSELKYFFPLRSVMYFWPTFQLASPKVLLLLGLQSTLERGLGLGGSLPKNVPTGPNVTAQETTKPELHTSEDEASRAIQPQHFSL